MSWFPKKTHDAVRLTWAKQHSAWDPLRADLEVPRVPAAPSLRSAAADFLAGLEAEVRGAERELTLASEAVRIAVIEFGAFDSAHIEPSEREGDLPPPLLRTTRRIAAQYKNGKEPT